MRRRLLIAVAIAFVAYVTIGIVLAGNEPAIAPAALQPFIFGHGRLYGRRITTPSWSADYDRIVTSTDQSVLELDGVRNGIIDRDGKPYLRISAHHVSVNTQTHDFSGTGGVRIEALAHDTPVRSLTTDTIIWSNAFQRLTVPGRLTIDSGTVQPLVADSLSFDVHAGVLKLGKLEGSANFK